MNERACTHIAECLNKCLEKMELKDKLTLVQKEEKMKCMRIKGFQKVHEEAD